MRFINRIIVFLGDITTVFYNLYIETRGWVYPFSIVANFFYTIMVLFIRINEQLVDFSQWVDNVTDKIASILTYENIASHFKSFFNMASDALEWTRNAFTNIKDKLTAWWSERLAEVVGRINYARQLLQSGIDAANKIITTIQETIANLKAKLPEKGTTAKEADDLDKTQTKTLWPLWEGWQEIRSQVVEFFTDPGKWFMDRIEGWLERFW